MPIFHYQVLAGFLLFFSLLSVIGSEGKTVGNLKILNIVM